MTSPVTGASALVCINSVEIRPVVIRGQRVLTLAQIDKVHGRPEGTAGRNFRENKSRLLEGQDWFNVSPDEIRRHSPDAVPAARKADMIVVTETGYLLLVKSFTDDLAWQIQRELVNAYFSPLEARTRAAHSNPPELSVYPAILTRTFGQLIKLGQLGGLDLDQARLAADRETFKRLGVSPLAILDIRAPANQPTYTIMEEAPGLAVLCASKLLQQHGERWTAADLHRALEQVGYLERRTLELVDKPARRYPVLIGDGLHYGANVKYSDRSLTTAPAYYVERFADLLDHLDPVLQEAAEHEAGALAGSSIRNMSHRQRQLYKASGLQAERRAEKRQRLQDVKRRLVVEAAQSGQRWRDVFRSLNLRRYFEPAELDELRALFHSKPEPAPTLPAAPEKAEHPDWSRPADLIDPSARAELQARNRFQPVTREQAREFLLEEAERFLVEGEDWTTFCYMRGRLFPMAFSDAEILSLHQAYERAFPTGLPLNWGGLIH